MNTRIARLQAYLTADPENLDLACELADVLLADGRYDEAGDVLSRLEGDIAKSSAVRFRLARCALVLGDYLGAESALEAAIADGDDGVALRHDLAFAQLCRRRVADAKRTIEEAVARFGADADLLVLHARATMMEGDFERAVALLDQALTLAPDHEQALGVRALALFDANRGQEAAAAAKHCLAQYPDQHEALLVAATQALWQQDLDLAESHLDRALARHRNSGRALSAQGQLLMLRNRLPEARDVLDRAVAAMPDHIGTWHALAWVQLLQGEPEAAERSYQRAYDIDRNFGDSHGGLALIAALRGDRDAADSGIKRALRLDPNSVTARYAETILLEDRGDHAAAETLLAGLARNTVASEVPIREFSARLRARLGAARGQG